MKKLNYLFFAITLFCLGAVLYILNQDTEEKTAFFLSAEVYNEFDYKKELEIDLNKTQNEAQRVIDSLELDIQMTANALKMQEPTQEQIHMFERKQQNYMEFRNQIESGYGVKSEEYYNQIWDRINNYVQDYGKENGYVFIFGANGDGSIMYAHESKDITTEIIEMINNKYAGE